MSDDSDVDWERWRETFDSGITAGYVSTQGRRAMVDEGRLMVRRWRDAGLFTDGASVLDMGCGNGRAAVGFLAFDVEYHGVDIIAEAVAFCRRAFGEVDGYRFDHLDVSNAFYNPNAPLHAEAVDFPRDTASVDLLIMSSVLTHVHSLAVIERYLAESRRVVRAGGHAFVSFFRSPPNKVSIDEARAVYPETQVCRALRESGWAIERESGGTTTRWTDSWDLVLGPRA